MNKQLFGLMVSGAVIALATQASALTVATNLVGNVQVTASATAQVGGNASGSTSTNVDVTGGLQAQVNSGAISASSDDAIVSLQGNSVDLIQTNDDLTAYNNLVVKARPAVKSVNVNSDNSVDVHYAQPAKFLGIFSTSVTGDVHVDAQGNTAVRMPWYAFLYSKDTTGVQASVATAVQQSGAQFGAQADASASAQNSARVVNAVSTAIQAQSQTSASATANTSASGY